MAERVTARSVAVLDDYQSVAAQCAPRGALGECGVTFLADHVADDDALAERLAPFDVIVAMRERTPFGYVSTGTYAVFYREAVECIRAYLDGKPVRVLA